MPFIICFLSVRKPHHLTESLPGKNAELQKQIAEVEEKLKEQKKGDPRFYMLLVSGAVVLMTGWYDMLVVWHGGLVGGWPILSNCHT